MADLISENLDVNQQLVQADLLNATPYLEDYLYKVFNDIIALNAEIEASGITGGLNLGTGAEVFDAAVGNDLTFRTLVSGDGSVTITEGATEIDLAAASLAGTEANSILTYDLGGGEYTELPQFRVSFTGGVITISQDDSLGAAVSMLVSDGDADVALFYDNTEMARTALAASGGFFVNNLSTGAGFERVLTTADLGGGGATVNAGTVEDSILHWNNATTEWDELAEVTMNVAANVLTISVEDAGAVLQPVIVADADTDLRGYYDGDVAFATLVDGLAVTGASGTDPHLRFFDTYGGTLEVQLVHTSTFFLFDTLINSETMLFRGRDAGAATSTMITTDPDGAVELYYDGTDALLTTSAGIFVRPVSGDNAQVAGQNSAGVTQGQIQFNNSTFGMLMYNLDLSGLISLLGEDSGSSLTTMAQFDPDGSVDLYFNGSETLETQAQGIHLVDSVGNDPFMGAYDSGGTGGTRLGFLQWNSTASRLRSERNSLHWEFIAADSIGTPHTAIEIDPDGAVTLEFDGDDVFSTTSQGAQFTATTGVAGVLEISADTGQATAINLEEGILTKAQFGYFPSTSEFTARVSDTGDDIRFYNVVDGDFITANGGGGVDLFFDGTLQTSTVINGLTVFSGASANAHIRAEDENGETALFRKLRTLQGGFTQVYGEENGANLQLLADDAGGTVQTILDGDPDGSALLYADGGLTLSIKTTGMQLDNNSGAGNTVLEINGNASTNPSINMEVTDTTKFQLQYLNDASDTIRFRLVDSGDIFLFSEDTAGTLLEFSDAGFGFNGATPIAAPNYTITNPTTNRSIDVSTITLGNLAQVVGTMIQDLIDYGLYQ